MLPSPIANWDDLRLLLEVARAGSLSAAAQRLGIDQSTVSRRLAALESRYGLRLFVRSAAGILPTLSGERVLARLELMDDLARDIDTALRDDRHEEQGVVRLTLTEALAIHFVVPRLPEFNARYPKLLIDLRCSDRVLALGRDTDIALRLSRPTELNAVLIRLGQIPYRVMATSTYLERHSMPRGVPEMIDHRLIDFMPFRQHPERRFDAWVDVADRAQRVSRLEGAGAFAAAVQHGLGLALCPAYAPAAAPTLQTVPVDMTCVLDVWLTYPEEFRHLRRIRVVVEFLRESFRAWAQWPEC